MIRLGETLIGFPTFDGTQSPHKVHVVRHLPTVVHGGAPYKHKIGEECGIELGWSSRRPSPNAMIDCKVSRPETGKKYKAISWMDREAGESQRVGRSCTICQVYSRSLLIVVPISCSGASRVRC